jgi:diguanylate cyclase (GGDEF)-like protein
LKQKRKFYYWIIIVLCTFLPWVIESILQEEMDKLSMFLWSIYLIPNFLLMYMYPKWKVIFGSMLFYSFLKYSYEFYFEDVFSDRIETMALFLSSIVNGAILITVGYFNMRYHQLFTHVQKLSLVDPLTGLFNRRYFNLYLEKAILLCEKDFLVLVMIDIDHFKNINDQYGHQCGDEALKHISDIIKNNIRNSDGYVRFGGEEFAIILPNTNLERGLAFAERIRAAVDQSTFTYKNNQIHFTISLGVSLYSGETEEEFIEKTDKALYQAKENGRNQVVAYHNIQSFP